jgi:hypothetical protein
VQGTQQQRQQRGVSRRISSSLMPLLLQQQKV